jgi:aryl-alcohol dehydrogenase-like predicted oxidoreductase
MKQWNNLSRIGLGLAALGRPGYINLGHAEDLNENYDVAAMEQRTHDMLDLAYEQGIRYFDAARSYGKAEQFLKSWLDKRGLTENDLIVGSKWGYTYTADWQIEAEQHEVKEHTLPVLQRQWSLSKNLLPQLRLYQIHSATFSSGVLDNAEVLDELARLKREFNIRIGLSLSGVDQSEVLQAAMQIERNGEMLFGAVQATFNVLEQKPAETLRQAAERGMIVIVKEALANGRLTARNEAPGFVTRKQILEKIAQKHQVGIDAIALAFVLAQPWASLVLSGAVVAAHLQSNLKALQVELDQNDLNTLQKLRMDGATYWAERSDLAWN